MRGKLYLFIGIAEFCFMVVGLINNWALLAAIGSGFGVADLAFFLSVNQGEK